VKKIVMFAVAWQISAYVFAAPALPSDVSQFIEKRESCDHWRSEVGYDDERQAEIDWAVCQSCPGTDSLLALLKQKYKDRAAIQEQLAQYDAMIEPKNKLKASRFCKRARKPK
jgi:hypothetical protein